MRERFKGTLSRDAQNAEWFHGTEQDRVAINHLAQTLHPKFATHAIGKRSPLTETLFEKPQISGTERACQTDQH